METAWVCLQIGWHKVSEKHQGRVNSVSQVDRDSIMALPCQLCQGRLSNGTMASDCISVWEEAAHTALILKPDNSVHPHMFWYLLSCCPTHVGAQNE